MFHMCSTCASRSCAAADWWLPWRRCKPVLEVRIGGSGGGRVRRSPARNFFNLGNWQRKCCKRTVVNNNPHMGQNAIRLFFVFFFLATGAKIVMRSHQRRSSRPRSRARGAPRGAVCGNNVGSDDGDGVLKGALRATLGVFRQRGACVCARVCARACFPAGLFFCFIFFIKCGAEEGEKLTRSF